MTRALGFFCKSSLKSTPEGTFSLLIILIGVNMSRQRNLKSASKLASDHAAPGAEKDDSSSKVKGLGDQEFIKSFYILLSVVVVLIVGLLIFTVTRVQFANPFTVTTKATIKSKESLITEEELLKHDGSHPNIPIYLSILGRIYDVDKGRQHYEVGSGYNVFAGRDSTPSFVTGVFSREQATDDVKGLSPEEMLGIKEWLDFYRKDYTYIGKLIGRYYDNGGNPTEALKEAKALIKEGQRLKKLQEAENKRFPGCNSRWSVEEGSTVWCSQNRYMYAPFNFNNLL